MKATMNHMVEIVRKMNTGDGGAIDGTASSRAVSSYTILSLDQSKTSPPKRRRARSTRISHQHHTFRSKKQHMHKRKRRRKRKKISPTEKKEATTKNLVYKSSVCMNGTYQLKQLRTSLWDPSERNDLRQREAKISHGWVVVRERTGKIEHAESIFEEPICST
ncbi:hypothetical protein HID58_066630 [Brassica napus]|uniref:Uncharacterized protein n=1 Tax=Brassica napus TaxID=3708 RepID=A0ABQ7ZGD5_BRANA|nr:hypothetical protein HID58_066630 [Brassica napus]